MSKEEEIDDLFKNAKDSTGFNRSLLEVKNLKAVTNLAIEMRNKLKTDFWYNMIYLLIGSILTYTITFLSSGNKQSELIELTRLITEKNAQEIQTQTEVRQMRLEITSLRKELDSLKN